MLENMLLVASQVGTLFLMMGVGFLLARRGKLKAETLSQLAYLLMTIISPCIIMDTLQADRTPELVAAMGQGAVLMLVLYLIWFVVAVPLFRKQPEYSRCVLQFGVVYSNTGFMGLPLVQSVLGPRGMLFATTPYVLFSAFSWSHGVALLGGRKNLSLKKMILNPGIISCAIGLTLFFLDTRLPPMLGSAVHFLGSMNTPLAMVVIGGQMALADLNAAVRDKRLYWASLARLVLYPAILLVGLLPFDMDPMMYTTYVILAATPAAGATAIFAQRFGRDSAIGAQLVTLSTLFSIVTLPVFAALAQVLRPL